MFRKPKTLEFVDSLAKSSLAELWPLPILLGEHTPIYYQGSFCTLPRALFGVLRFAELLG